MTEREREEELAAMDAAIAQLDDPDEYLRRMGVRPQ